MSHQDTITALETQIADLAAKKASLCKYTTKTIAIAKTCGRCGGSGIYTHYHGVCYDCGGRGTMPGTKRVRVFPQGSTPEQIAAWEAEIARRSEIRRLKKDLAKAQAAYEYAVSAEAAANDFIESYMVEGQDLAAALKTDHDISRDLKEKLFKYGKLSTAQVNLAFKLQKQAAERAEENANAMDAPTGRVSVHGVILSTRTQFSQYGEVEKMLVKDERGFKVWCSVPSGLNQTERGTAVSIKVTLKPSGDDPKFAFGSRPKALLTYSQDEGDAMAMLEAM